MRIYHQLSAIDRFLKYVSPEPNSGCWLWDGALTRGDYGTFAERTGRGKEKIIIRAHRFAYKYFRGLIPEGLQALHKCDVRGCVNPDHLFLGTSADNMADKKNKGRAQRGEQVPNARLTERDVLAIRADERPDTAIARQYGVSRATVSYIQQRATWRHV